MRIAQALVQLDDIGRVLQRVLQLPGGGVARRGDPARSCRVAEALRAGIEGVGRRLGYPAGLVTVSVGIAEFDPRRPAEGDLLVAADRALYRAKASGRNLIAEAQRLRQHEVTST